MNKRIVFGALLTTAVFFLPGVSHARMYNANTGRFQTMDSYEGDSEDPLSLHKYLYSWDNPVDIIDPSGLSGTLTIYANEFPKGSFFDVDGGHAWISYAKDGGALVTYGTWGNHPRDPDPQRNRKNGLHVNLELGRQGEAARSAHVNDASEKELMSTVSDYAAKGDDGWSVFAPCSAFASEAWYSATGENLRTRFNVSTTLISPILGALISTPSQLKRSIISANGGKNNGTLTLPGGNRENSSVGFSLPVLEFDDFDFGGGLF
jgi:hypothetical protein